MKITTLTRLAITFYKKHEQGQEREILHPVSNTRWLHSDFLPCICHREKRYS